MPRIAALLTLLSPWLLAFAAPAAGEPAGAAPGPEPLTREELVHLARGGEVARLVPLPGEGRRGGLAARVIHHPAERIARAAADADHWAEWVPFLTRSERGREASGRPLWHLAFDLPALLRDRRYSIRMATPAMDGAGAWTVSWTSIPGSGNVAWARGSLRLTPRGPAITLVVFRTASDPGDATPRFLHHRVLLQSLPWVLDGLRQQAGRCRYTVPWPEGCREERPWRPALPEEGLPPARDALPDGPEPEALEEGVEELRIGAPVSTSLTRKEAKP